MNFLETLASMVESLAGAIKIALTPIPGILLDATCARRPGFSSYAVSGKASAAMSDKNPSDILKEFIYKYVETFKIIITEDAVCNIVFPPGSLVFSLAGANAGGPANLVGTNLNFVLAWGIIR